MVNNPRPIRKPFVPATPSAADALLRGLCRRCVVYTRLGWKNGPLSQEEATSKPGAAYKPRGYDQKRRKLVPFRLSLLNNRSHRLAFHSIVAALLFIQSLLPCFSFNRHRFAFIQSLPHCLSYSRRRLALYYKRCCLLFPLYNCTLWGGLKAQQAHSPGQAKRHPG